MALTVQLSVNGAVDPGHRRCGEPCPGRAAGCRPGRGDEADRDRPDQRPTVGKLKLPNTMVIDMLIASRYVSARTSNLDLDMPFEITWTQDGLPCSAGISRAPRPRSQ
jgi:hypothetical protein